MNNFPAMTEKERNAILRRCDEMINGWESDDTDELIAKIALAALTAEPEAYLTVRLPGVKGIGNARKIIDGKQYDPTKDSYWSPGGKDKHIVVPLYPAPPVPVLRVPDEVSCEGLDPQEADEARNLGQCEGWNQCLAEIKSLNSQYVSPEASNEQ